MEEAQERRRRLLRLRSEAEQSTLAHGRDHGQRGDSQNDQQQTSEAHGPDERGAMERRNHPPTSTIDSAGVFPVDSTEPATFSFYSNPMSAYSGKPRALMSRPPGPPPFTLSSQPSEYYEHSSAVRFRPIPQNYRQPGVPPPNPQFPHHNGRSLAFQPRPMGMPNTQFHQSHFHTSSRPSFTTQNRENNFSQRDSNRSRTFVPSSSHHPRSPHFKKYDTPGFDPASYYSKSMLENPWKDLLTHAYSQQQKDQLANSDRTPLL